VSARIWRWTTVTILVLTRRRDFIQSRISINSKQIIFIDPLLKSVGCWCRLNLSAEVRFNHLKANNTQSTWANAGAWHVHLEIVKTLLYSRGSFVAFGDLSKIGHEAAAWKQLDRRPEDHIFRYSLYAMVCAGLQRLTKLMQQILKIRYLASALKWWPYTYQVVFFSDLTVSVTMSLAVLYDCRFSLLYRRAQPRLLCIFHVLRSKGRNRRAYRVGIDFVRRVLTGWRYEPEVAAFSDVCSGAICNRFLAYVHYEPCLSGDWQMKLRNRGEQSLLVFRMSSNWLSASRGLWIYKLYYHYRLYRRVREMTTWRCIIYRYIVALAG